MDLHQLNYHTSTLYYIAGVLTFVVSIFAYLTARKALLVSLSPKIERAIGSEEELFVPTRYIYYDWADKTARIKGRGKLHGFESVEKLRDLKRKYSSINCRNRKGIGDPEPLWCITTGIK
jgi:hypothetical protein